MLNIRQSPLPSALWWSKFYLNHLIHSSILHSEENAALLFDEVYTFSEMWLWICITWYVIRIFHHGIKQKLPELRLET